MKLRNKRHFPATTGLGLSLAAVAAFAVACGGSGGGGGSSASPASGHASAPAAGPSSGGSASAATIGTRSGGAGTYLTGGSGRTVYLWAADKDGRSTCSGGCAAGWPPVTTTGTPKAGPGVAAGRLSTTTRADGSKQITYDGHPLYYFSGDRAAGDTNGQGNDGFGAKWWLVGPDGSRITKAAPSATGGSGSGSGNNGGGYGSGGW
ncbi:hypothetical protein GCM10018793_64480 [Streptomyces sulfonofaciens]|uniref:Lipoprotein n=1 Tax=Streptomyces sulfonofaciens TaxID=68272 RepID=A0A919L8B6_9ACTN|nr:hypothetical protein [Streptomyces sulfonofaciens]GHH87672.1 hypothetical protein GCM10018793_64480 [Streptomyces sulfonofaciens]